MADDYDEALGHLRAAMAAMDRCGDTLAVAMIAQAVGVVEAARGRRGMGAAADGALRG